MGERPAGGDLGCGPRGDAIGVGADDDVEVVAHHSVGQDIDGIRGGSLLDEFADPAPAVLGIVTAEEGAADAAGEDMIAARAVVGHEETARDGHGRRIRSAWTYCKQSQGVR